MTAPQIFVGTAGWSYPDWEDVVYPRGKAGERLQTVANYLDCVEVDSTFYRPAPPRTTENWLKNLEHRPEFRFLAKAWQRFTHERSQRWTQAEFDLFTRGLAPLREAGRLDALLFQFPWSFRSETQARDWLAAIADAFAGWPVAIEVRHDSWLRDETLELFRARGITFCNIDQPALGHCLRPTAVATTATGYYRLHGRNAKNWFREQQDVYGGRYDSVLRRGVERIADEDQTSRRADQEAVCHLQQSQRRQGLRQRAAAQGSPRWHNAVARAGQPADKVPGPARVRACRRRGATAARLMLRRRENQFQTTRDVHKLVRRYTVRTRRQPRCLGRF